MAWLALLAVGPLLYALMLLLAALNFRRLRLRSAPPLVPIPREAMAPDARTVLDAMQPELQALGFTWRASLRGNPPAVMQPEITTDLDLYAHASGQAWAVAQPYGNGYGRAYGAVEWLVCFADGRNWSCVNGQAHEILDVPPGWTCFDDLQPDTAAAWQACARRLEAANTPVVADQDEVLRRLAEARQGMAASLAAQGRAHAAGPGLYQLTWRESLRATWRLARGQQQLARQAGQAARTAPPPTPELARVRQASEALGFEQQEALLAALHAVPGRRHTFWLTALLLAVGCALFLAVGSTLFSWRLAWMLLLVIALDKGGQWLAMRWAGYQRQSVFFLPGLGDITTGEKPDATPLRKALVYLAGPLPGLLLGMGALAAVAWGPVAAPGWAMEWLGVCLLANYFNLLPLTPLDGGRVLESLLFARLPALRLVFALASIGALAGLGLYLHSPIFGILAGILACGLPWHWRLMCLERAVRQAHPRTAPLDAAAATRRLFGVLQQPAFARWPFARRVAAVRGLRPALQSRAPGWAEGAGGLLIYLACLALPPGTLLAVHSLAPQGSQVLLSLVGLKRPPPGIGGQGMQGIETGLAQALEQPGANRVATTLDAAKAMYMFGTPESIERAQTLYQEAWTLTQSRSPHDMERAQALLGMANTAPESESPTPGYLQLLTDLQGAQGPARLLLAQVQETLVQLPPPEQTRAQRLALARQAVENRRAESRLDDSQLLRSRELLARLLDTDGHAQAAQAQLQANLAALEPSAGATAPRPGTSEAWQMAFDRIQAEDLYAWFLIDHGQAHAAMALAARAATAYTGALEDHDPWLIDDSLRTWLWAAIESQDAAEVRQALERQRQHWSGQRARRPHNRDALDQLVAAQMLGDAALREQAVAALAALPCQQLSAFYQPGELRNDWQQRARARQQAALSAEGKCP